MVGRSTTQAVPCRSLGDEATANLCPSNLEMDMEENSWGVNSITKVSGWRFTKDLCLYQFAIILIPVSIILDDYSIFAEHLVGIWRVLSLKVNYSFV